VLDYGGVAGEIRADLPEEDFAEAYAKGLTTTMDTIHTATDQALTPRPACPTQPTRVSNRHDR
ncbi:hypothetical protein, partial [Actinophytocola sp.]|uniref:hypothetical protein n=1 Tax=Actinophytocola sp. TaxID=1872138 RepID=UPI00389AAD4E